jgi:hypothetical protein
MKNQPMGGWFHLLPPEYQAQTSFWSQQILCAISNETTIKESAELEDIQRAQCGYQALYSIMRSIHPRLMITQPLIRPPIYDNSASLSDYLNHWFTFLILEQEQGNPWNPIRAVRNIIGYLPIPHNCWILTNFELQCARYSHDESFLPPEYNMATIAGTIKDLMKTNPHRNFQRRYNSPPRHATKSTIHSVRFTDAPDDFFDDEIPDTENGEIHSLHNTNSISTTGCKFCKDSHHKTTDCYKAIAAAQVFAKKPGLAQQLLQKQSTPQQPSRTNRNHSIRHLNSNDDTSDPDLSDIDPLANTDISSINCLRCNNDTNDDMTAGSPISKFSDITDGIQSIVLNVVSDVFTDGDNIHSCGEQIITPIVESNDAPKILAQFDGGANICATNKVSALWNLHKLDTPKVLSAYNKGQLVANYRGYLVFRTNSDKEG